MARRRKMDPERKAFISSLLEHYQPKDAQDIQDMLKDLLGETLQGMLEAEMDDHLGYSKYDYKNKETDDSRNGYSPKTVTRQHHFSELCDRETNDTIVSIYCKLEIYIIRFCLIIQLARWTCGECDKTCIDLLTVERAIKLTEYFKESALNVQNVLNENTLNSQQQTIVNLLPPSFTTAQAMQIAEQNGMKERTFQRFLNDNIGTLFRKEKHGEYSKTNP